MVPASKGNGPSVLPQAPVPVHSEDLAPLMPRALTLSQAPCLPAGKQAQQAGGVQAVPGPSCGAAEFTGNQLGP